MRADFFFWRNQHYACAMNVWSLELHYFRFCQLVRWYSMKRNENFILNLLGEINILRIRSWDSTYRCAVKLAHLKDFMTLFPPWECCGDAVRRRVWTRIFLTLITHNFIHFFIHTHTHSLTNIWLPNNVHALPSRQWCRKKAYAKFMHPTHSWN